MAGMDTCMPESDVELLRACGELHYALALESACGLVMFIWFAMVTVKIHARSHLRMPAAAFLRFCRASCRSFMGEFCQTIRAFGRMPKVDLQVRLRFCTNLDKMANILSAFLSLLGVMRWSFSDVNAMRYIGYALTCPLTQVELVVMLAPIVPCFRLTVVFMYLITFCTLAAAYCASLVSVPLWRGDLLVFLSTGDLADLEPTRKLAVVSPGFVGIGFVFVVVMPYLLLLYRRHGGGRNLELPQGYTCLLCIIWFTWIFFPVWWMLSWEGMHVIQDTEFNELGFTVLNVTAKGLFTLQSFRIEGHEARRRARRPAEAEKSSVPQILSQKHEEKVSQSLLVEALSEFDSNRKDSDSDNENNNVVKSDLFLVLEEGFKSPKPFEGRRIPEPPQSSWGIPGNEQFDMSNPWFRSCLERNFRPVVGRRPEPVCYGSPYGMRVATKAKPALTLPLPTTPRLLGRECS